jgi:hypothetical protein
MMVLVLRRRGSSSCQVSIATRRMLVIALYLGLQVTSFQIRSRPAEATADHRVHAWIQASLRAIACRESWKNRIDTCQRPRYFKVLSPGRNDEAEWQSSPKLQGDNARFEAFFGEWAQLGDKQRADRQSSWHITMKTGPLGGPPSSKRWRYVCAASPHSNSTCSTDRLQAAPLMLSPGVHDRCHIHVVTVRGHITYREDTRGHRNLSQWCAAWQLLGSLPLQPMIHSRHHSSKEQTLQLYLTLNSISLIALHHLRSVI